MGDGVVEYRYRLTVSGALGNAARYAFEDFTIEPADREPLLSASLTRPRCTALCTAFRASACS